MPVGSVPVSLPYSIKSGHIEKQPPFPASGRLSFLCRTIVAGMTINTTRKMTIIIMGDNIEL